MSVCAHSSPTCVSKISRPSMMPLSQNWLLTTVDSNPPQKIPPPTSPPKIFPCHALSLALFTLTHALCRSALGSSPGGISTFLHVVVTDQPPRQPVSMWLPAGVYLWQRVVLTPMGARCNPLEVDEGNRREESWLVCDVHQSFLSSYRSSSVCRRMCACVRVCF